MRVPVDECLPRQLRQWLSAERPQWAVKTVHEAGWASMTNGLLLRTANGAFDALVTADKNMHHQQNFVGLDIAVLVFPNQPCQGRQGRGGGSGPVVGQIALRRKDRHGIESRHELGRSQTRRCGHGTRNHAPRLRAATGSCAAAKRRRDLRQAETNDGIRVISLRKANDREVRHHAKLQTPD